MQLGPAPWRTPATAARACIFARGQLQASSAHKTSSRNAVAAAARQQCMRPVLGKLPLPLQAAKSLRCFVALAPMPIQILRWASGPILGLLLIMVHCAYDHDLNHSFALYILADSD